MRHSVDAAEWSSEREDQYQRNCHDIAKRAGIGLVVRDSSVYVQEGALESLLVTAAKPKRLWYETWLALAERFPALAKPR